jgi:outer membrane protein assembly factor BamB
VVIAATGKSRGYDLDTGKELWRLGGMTTNTIPTPVPGDGLVYLASGYRGNMLQAVALAAASGDLNGSEAVRWSHDRDTPYVPSLLLTGGRIYMIKHFRNILSVLHARTGDVLYQTRLPGVHDIWASPVAADGRVYVFDRDGHALVLRDGDRLEVIATNVLDEGSDASPAVVGDDLFVRTTGHLYRIVGAKETGSDEQPAARAEGSP